MPAEHEEEVRALSVLPIGEVMELVYIIVSDTMPAGREGSSPSFPTSRRIRRV